MEREESGRKNGKIANPKEDKNKINYILEFKDRRNFLATSLEKPVSELIETYHDFTLFTNHMKTLGYSSNVINMVKRECISPYEHVTNKSVL